MKPGPLSLSLSKAARQPQPHALDLAPAAVPKLVDEPWKVITRGSRFTDRSSRVAGGSV
jgi:hypothetical protein